MSKERIEINFHYGQEDFKKLFEELIRTTVANQQFPGEIINNSGVENELQGHLSLYRSETVK